jgi:hypothetical protein
MISESTELDGLPLLQFYPGSVRVILLLRRAPSA